MVLLFGLAAVLLGAAGLILKLLVKAAGSHPVAAAVTAAAIGAAGLLLRRTRSRRVTGRTADGLADLTQEIAEGSEAEPERMGETTPPGEGPPERFEAGDYAAMDPDTFEQAIAALCERDGCRDVQVVGGAGDLGADVVAIAPDGRRIVIQCKRYGPLNKVGSQDLQRFGGTCFAVHEAHVAAVITTGEFTEPAAEYGEQCGIHCVDQAALVAWTDGAGPAPWDIEVRE
ncbi:restriction endonuclease [Streptomyces sp. NBC_00344]|uniref:restriction endonuclease n=1 Tax=Streptomyces sp. NBC_00344 TaxID=2975720 RepID=UPI002E21E385